MAFGASGPTAQVPFKVTYKGFDAGEYFADIVVDNALVIELKCVDRFANEHIAQCLNYLRAANLSLCLLVNFQKPKFEWKRGSASCIDFKSAFISVHRRPSAFRIAGGRSTYSTQPDIISVSLAAPNRTTLLGSGFDGLLAELSK